VIDLPYFDQLLEGRRRGEESSKVFERYVHWGYWEDPTKATRDLAEFEAAMERLDREVVAACDIQSGQAVLDAGCGFGGTLAAIGARWQDLRLTGINIDRRQLDIARTQVPGASFVEGDACTLPFEAATFDRVLAIECIFHFPSRLGFLKEAARVLKPGGRLSLSDFVPASLANSRTWIGRIIERQISKGFGHFTDWANGNYQSMAQTAGLRVVVERDVTANTLPTYPVILNLLRARRAAGHTKDCMSSPARLLQWVSKLGFVRYRIVGFEKSESSPDPIPSRMKLPVQ
jgi:ubiquinone/menaquinone biosynthesis C-methylase UbiE